MHEFDTRSSEHLRAPERVDIEERTARHGVETLQSTVGNAAVGRLLNRHADHNQQVHRFSATETVNRSAEQPEEEEINASHDTSFAGSVQRVSEEESDAVPEDELQAMHDASATGFSSATSLHRSVARASDGTDEVPEDQLQASHDPLQRAPEVGLAGGPVSANLASRIDSARGAGSPLDDTTRTTMEGTLGTDLGSVRVHVGRESDELNHAITAKAFTTGNDVFVRSDQWAPGSSSTQRLLAHELTHVAQQRSGEGSDAGSGMTVGASDSAAEHEAESVADSIG